MYVAATFSEPKRIAPDHDADRRGECEQAKDRESLCAREAAAHQLQCEGGAHTMIVIRAFVLALAAGTFLYMGTMHELRHSPLIRDCARLKGFVAMLAGLMLTALVRFLIGEAHRL